MCGVRRPEKSLLGWRMDCMAFVFVGVEVLFYCLLNEIRESGGCWEMECFKVPPVEGLI